MPRKPESELKRPLLPQDKRCQALASSIVRDILKDRLLKSKAKGIKDEINPNLRYSYKYLIALCHKYKVDSEVPRAESQCRQKAFIRDGTNFEYCARHLSMRRTQITGIPMSKHLDLKMDEWKAHWLTLLSPAHTAIKDILEKSRHDPSRFQAAKFILENTAGHPAEKKANQPSGNTNATLNLNIQTAEPISLISDQALSFLTYVERDAFLQMLEKIRNGLRLQLPPGPPIAIQAQNMEESA